MSPIDLLKQLVIESKDIEEPMNYFFDLMEQKVIFNLKGHGEIRKVEKQSELFAILDIIQYSVKRRLGTSIKIINSLFFSALDHQFYHGACRVQGFPLPLTALYFSDIKIGIFVISDMQNTEFFRFSLMKVDERTKMH